MNKDPPNKNKGCSPRAGSSEGLGHHHLGLAETRGRQGRGELYGGQRDGSRAPCSEAGGPGKQGWANYQWGVPCHWLGYISGFLWKVGNRDRN